MAQFDWVDFYKAFAKTLLNYKDNRSALIQTIKKIYEKIEINLPTLERDNQIVDIDPFTVFGLFNKSKLKESNRVKIITAFANVFCQVLFPEKSVGIPFFQQGIFPAFSGHYASLRMRACSIR